MYTEQNYHPLELKKNQHLYQAKTGYWWKRAQNWYSGMQNMSAKMTTMRMFYVHVVLDGVIFPQIL